MASDYGHSVHLFQW